MLLLRKDLTSDRHNKIKKKALQPPFCVMYILSRVSKIPAIQNALSKPHKILIKAESPISLREEKQINSKETH